jgi:hypothetical protein
MISKQALQNLALFRTRLVERAFGSPTKRAKDIALKDERQETSAQKQRIEEAKSYQREGEGFFSLLWVIDGEFRQYSYLLSSLQEVLGNLKEGVDTWISQAKFVRANRRLVNFYSVAVFFCDLDTYKDERLRQLEPMSLLKELLFLCALEDLKPPSLVVFSGRGLQAKWLLEEEVDPLNLSKWRACQKEIATKLKPMGADHFALDPSRVLRVVGTTNTKSGQLVEVVHGQLNEPIRYDFTEMCEQLIPRNHPVYQPEQPSKRRAKAHRSPSKKQKGDAGKFGPELYEWSWETNLATLRFYDLRKLIELRGGRVEEGSRMHFLFWCLNFFCFTRLVDDEKTLMEEAQELVNVIDPDWNFERSALSTLLSKSIAHSKGKVLVYNGHTYPPLYTPKNDYLVDLFSITVDEQHQLNSIHSTAVAHQRRLLSYERRHRKDGRVSRQEYLESVTDSNLREKIASLRQKGMSTRAISKIVGVNQTRVCKILNDI